MDLLYEGKSKRVYKLDEDKVLLEFKDTFSAFDGEKIETVNGKGEVNAIFTEVLMRYLNERGIPTQFVSRDSNKIIALRSEPLPLEFIVRNYAFGSLLKRMPLFKKGEKLKKPIFEIHFKSDELHDPLLSYDDPIAAGLLSEEELKHLRDLSLRINDILRELFERAGYELVDLKLEFGKRGDEFILIDELSPDVFRAWKDGSSYDKDLFRKGKSGRETLDAYKVLLNDLIKVL
ncbi:phosphoribosylaminoimidazole-succinocarboxamide synthase [Ignicoccus islandicus DSM 13165]|uniref:Phosphoribosylaminoimidazole-succinocarboxamide synthase n=1 Tax=Ignicoccus islandicus DSM 13165 TaxID=940295 RepID=A0A0U3F7Y2_9CREN|nr:phosphoribosylaminoimidazolesuccinocarboxamide synthase [Ignicoccus islandicus]ALU11737.1 phosphoribosylaminoimidazole-succinocarboxamide synthase [Ignicoccus islandicus DSM 13165]